MHFNLPLMENNITREDLEVLINFLKGFPRLTQFDNVIAFEREWSDWLNVKYSVFVNSGASANLITIIRWWGNHCPHINLGIRYCFSTAIRLQARFCRHKPQKSMHGY